MNPSTLQNIPPHSRQTGASLAALIPILLVEIINHGQINLWALPFLLIGVFLGLRRGGALWAGWWFSWCLVVIGDAWMFGPAGREPILSILWQPALLLLAGFFAFYLWQRADGFLAVFALLPCLLEFPRLLLFNDLPGDDSSPFFQARAVSVLVYILVAIFVFGPTIRRRWWILFSAVLVQFVVVAVLASPILAGFILYPTFLAPFLLLAFGPALLGFILERLRSTTVRWKQIIWVGVIVVMFIGGLLPVFTGDLLSPSSPAPAPGSKRQSVIVDTDMSHDDVVALLFLLKRPELDIRAISVVNGVAHVKPGLENLRRILALAGRTDIPVAGGPGQPLDGNRAFPDDWRTLVDLPMRPALPSVPPATQGLSAAQLIVRETNNASGPVQLIALGPLTNVALAIRQDPALATRLDSIFISGGAIDAPGAVHAELPSNPNDAADWNLYLDPVAADEVFRSGARLILAPLDVTLSGAHPLLLSTTFIDKFVATAKGPEARLMAGIMRGSELMLDPSAPGVQMWDLPAVVIALEPQVCTRWRNNLALRIVLAPDNVAGKTSIETGQPVNARACMDGDLAAFEHTVLLAGSAN